MKKLRLMFLLVSCVLVMGWISPAESSALEYCWALSGPVGSAQSVRVGVLDLGNGHFTLAGQATYPNVLNGGVMGYMVSGNAEVRNNVLEVSLHMTSRDDVSAIPGDANSILTAMIIHMRVAPATLNGDYSMMVEGSKGAYQIKGVTIYGKATSVRCN
ncbi:MAG: hypothetical protein HQK58_16035 [Deltaproteobacteria bacterium]|nr:hypothetical protein [Deltaproteobacteria bacterium]